MFAKQQIIWCLLATLYVALSAGIVIELPNGKVEGQHNTTFANTSYYSFLSLRYAQPPVGDLRFKSPQPLTPWNGTYDATKETTICYQSLPTRRNENEDCLLLNVFTPKDLSKRVKANLTVMVYIHGGGFNTGPNIGGPEFFMDFNVIMVVIQFRLGLFGFATTGDTLIPGNMGLKDQTLALKWIQENIAFFGGDPRKVTLIGESSGGACVSYHILNSNATGLFRAAIMESGSALNPWAYQRHQAKITQLVGAIVEEKISENDLRTIDIEKIPNFYSNTTEIFNLLKSANVSKLADATKKLFTTTQRFAFQFSQGLLFAPVIEVEHDEAFITETPFELFKSGSYNRVPVIIGHNEEEGLLIFNNSTMVEVFKQYDQNPTKLVPWNMHITDKKNQSTVAELIKDFYSPQKNFTDAVISGIKYHTTHDFQKGSTKEAELQAPFNHVYFYNFNYSGIMGNNVNFRLLGTSNVTHGEQTQYYFSTSQNRNLTIFPSQDRKVHNRIMTLWTNFAKHLNPTPKEQEVLQNVTWPKVTAKFVYLDIEKNLKIKTGYPNKYYQFWTNLYNNYAVPPLDTF